MSDGVRRGWKLVGLGGADHPRVAERVALDLCSRVRTGSGEHGGIDQRGESGIDYGDEGFNDAQQSNTSFRMTGKIASSLVRAGFW
jgi:hypothetical protein